MDRDQRYKDYSLPKRFVEELRQAVQDFGEQVGREPLPMTELGARALIYSLVPEIIPGARVLHRQTGEELLVMGTKPGTGETAVFGSEDVSVRWCKSVELEAAPLRLIMEIPERDTIHHGTGVKPKWIPFPIRRGPHVEELGQLWLSDAEAIRRALRYYLGIGQDIGTRMVIVGRSNVLLSKDIGSVVAVDLRGVRSMYPQHLAKRQPVPGAMLAWEGPSARTK